MKYSLLAKVVVFKGSLVHSIPNFFLSLGTMNTLFNLDLIFKAEWQTALVPVWLRTNTYQSDNSNIHSCLHGCSETITHGHLIGYFVACFSGTQLCLMLGDSMDCSMTGLPVLHYLPEFAQSHVHRFGAAIQPSHSLLPSSSPALSLSQNQGLFQWVGSSHQIPKYWSFSFSISPSTEYSGLISFGLSDLISCCLRDSQESTPAPQFESINSLVFSLLYGPTLT